MNINGIDLNKIDKNVLEQAKAMLAASGVEPEKIDKAIEAVDGNKFAEKQVSKMVDKAKKSIEESDEDDDLLEKMKEE